MKEELLKVLAPYRDRKGALIPVLQTVQEKFGYISEEAVSEIAKFLKISPNQVFGVASFYAQFRFQPQGEHMVKVCQGTACHVRGSLRILEAVEEKLGIQPGGTTADRKFSLERVACFGACALAPVMVVDGTVYGSMTIARAKKLLAEYSQKPQNNS